MKVYIGPYRDTTTVYDLAGLLKYVGVSEARCDRVAEWLATKNWLVVGLDKLTSRERTIDVVIDAHDTWSMDHTLAHIIVPMLIQLKATKHGAPLVDDCDVHAHLQSTAAAPKAEPWDIDEHHFERWDWVLDEMIWSFQQQLTDWEQQYYSGTVDFVWGETKNGVSEMTTGPNHNFTVDQDGHADHQHRMNRGFKLFGKYYQALWD